MYQDVNTTRSRFKIDRQESELYHNAYTEDTNPTEQYVQSGQVVLDKVTRTTDDINDPGYYAKRRNGDIVANEYSSVLDRRYAGLVTTGLLSQERPGAWIRKHTGTAPYTGVNDAPWSSLNHEDYEHFDEIDDAIDMLEVKANANLNQTSLESLVMIAEMRKTVDFLFDGVIRGHKVLKSTMKRAAALARGNSRTYSIKDIYSLTKKEWAPLWLSARYGLRPIIYDIESSLEALQKHGQPVRQRFSAEDNLTKITPWLSPEVPITYGSNRFDKAVCQFRGDVIQRYNISSGLLASFDTVKLSLSQTYGLKNIGTLAWEITPWSFVIDWFINIGETIRAIEANLQSNVLLRWNIVREDFILRAPVDPDTCIIKDPSRSTDVWTGLDSVTGVQVWERKATYRRIPSSVLLVPRLRMNLSPSKVTDLLALFHQKMK